MVYRKPPTFLSTKKTLKNLGSTPRIPSHHQDYYIFSLGNLKLNLSLATGILGGGVVEKETSHRFLVLFLIDPIFDPESGGFKNL